MDGEKESRESVLSACLNNNNIYIYIYIQWKLSILNNSEFDQKFEKKSLSDRTNVQSSNTRVELTKTCHIMYTTVKKGQKTKLQIKQQEDK